MSDKRKRIILVARYYSIEALGIMYLAGVVRQEEWECKVVLICESNFGPLYMAVQEWKPDLVGFQIWTGYHMQAFKACDVVRDMGTPVIIGGPHATYFHEECTKHADFVVQGEGFRLLRSILRSKAESGVLFDMQWAEEDFPLPSRAELYDAYPEFGRSPIKSVFASVGCPYHCTYCYAPVKNEMYGGFRLSVRSVDDIVTETLAIKNQWPLAMIYFQDDVFGFNMKWLEEFARRWPLEVNVPFHCQMRLEMTRHDPGDRRLDLFVLAGCSGITLAIESDSDFLRDHVLFRHMPSELIKEGCAKILNRGMSLRTEQILAVPFSTIDTDIATLSLNADIYPTMAWTSILVPYGGTAMGTIASSFGLYKGVNDDLTESFFDSSILRHIEGGPRDIEPIIERLGKRLTENVILSLTVEPCDGLSINILYEGERVGKISYLTPYDNKQYCSQVVRLQRLFIWLAKMPNAEILARVLVWLPDEEWTWYEIGKIAGEHLLIVFGQNQLECWKQELAVQMGFASFNQLPEPMALNPWFFTCFPAGGELAKEIVLKEVFTSERKISQSLDALNTISRHHLFDYSLYRIKTGAEPIMP